MNPSLRNACAALLAATATLPCDAIAETARPAAPGPFSLTLGLGAQYDSNVSVEEADINIRKGDIAAVASVAAAMTVASRKSSLRFGYSYDDARNRDLTDYDIAVHGLSAGATRKLGRITAAVDYQFSHVLLGEHPYLDMHMVSPALSGFATRRLFVRAAVTYLRKDFKTTPQLNADTTLIGLDGYRFFARRKGYVAAGLRIDDEIAQAPSFSYGAFQASLRAQVPFRLLGHDAKARLGYAWQERQYRDPTPSIGTARHETRSTVTAGLDWPVTRALTWRSQLRYIDRHSNVAIYDYRERMASTMLVWKL